MKISKNLLISLLLVALLMLPATVITPNAAVLYAKPSIPEAEKMPPSQSKQSGDSRSNDVLRQFESYLPKEQIDPGIKIEIHGGASDVKIIVFYDLALKKSVIASVPSSVRIRTDFSGALPFLSMKAPADMSVIEAIAEIPGVRGVYLDRKLYTQVMTDEQVAGSPVAQFESPYEGVPPFLLNQTTELIGARQLWDLGFTGEGVVIAITDTGINKTHPDFYFADTGKNKVIFEYVSVDADFNGVPDVGPEDAHGHGTHVASIAAGTGRTGGADYFYDPTNGTYRTIWLNPEDEKGVAPDAYLMNIKISQVGWAYTSWMMEGYVQAVLHGADIISTSFGGHYDYPPYDFPFLYTVEWAVQNGVVVSISAGNEGPDFGTISSVGYSDSVICVGATTKLDRIAWFSSRGPSTALAIFGNSFFPSLVPYTNASGSQKMKPDIVAPGIRISAANAFYSGGYTPMFGEVLPEGYMYVSVSGTSMAAPHVAGAAALLLQAFPGAKPAAVKAGLLKGAADLGLDPNVQGFGRLNVTAAYDMMNEAEKASNTIGSPQEDIPAYPPTYEPYPYFDGLDILVEDTICNYLKFSEFIDILESYGANIYYFSDEIGIGFNLTNYDMFLMLEPTTKGTTPPYPTWLNNLTITDYVTKWGGKLLFTGDWLSMIPKPDDTTPGGYGGYNYYTKAFGITWQDTVGGGYSTNIASHAITTEVDTLYFGGPLGSLVTGSGAATIAYDPVFPGVDVFTSGAGKLVVISDDDVLDDAYLTNPSYVSDNLRLGLNIIAWFADIATTIFDEKHTVDITDIGIGITYPLYVVNGTSATITTTICNFGNTTESTVHTRLLVYNSIGALTYNETISKSPTDGLKPNENTTITFSVPPENITSGSLLTDTAYIVGTVSLWANCTSPYGDDYPANNLWPWMWYNGAINLIAKNARIGDNPILSLTEPNSYDSYTSPFVATFPGDWKALNMTFVTSGDIVNGTMRIEGNVTDIADFYTYNYTSEKIEALGDNVTFTLKNMGWWQPTNRSIWLDVYEYGWSRLLEPYPPYIIPTLNSTGHAFGYLEVKIPKNATTGIVYSGSVGVYNGTTLLSSMPMDIEVKKPLAKLLYDDLGHYWMLLWSLIYIYEYWEWPDDWLYDYKFLWNAYYDLWVKASQWGLDIDSLVMTEYFMETDLEEVLEGELPWRYEQIIASTFEETYSPYGVILEFNNKLLDLYYDFSWVYYRELDSGLYGPSYVLYTLQDIYDLILKAKGNVVAFADELPSGQPWNPYNDILNFVGADIELSDTSVFNWTVTRDHMADFPHWITHNVENFTMAGWCWPGYAGEPLDWGGYFLDIPELGTTAKLIDVESPHPYENNYTNEWNITVPGAEYIRVHFSRIDLGTPYPDATYRTGDWITIYDNNHTAIQKFGTNNGIRWTDTWTSWVPGNTTYIDLYTDQDLQAWGFQIDMYEYRSKDGVQILSMATEEETSWLWGPVMAIDEHLAPLDTTGGISPSTGLPYIGSKVFVLGEANQFENLFLEYQDWLTSDITSLTAGYGETMMWTIETLLHNILTYMSDSSPPTTTLTYSGPSYVRGGIYVNASTVFTISASDPLTDIEATYYKINEEEWITYSGPFNLTARADGNYTMCYYSMDVLGNVESEKSRAVYLDNTPPNLEIKSVTITPSLTTSSITVSWLASDGNGSGVDHVEIRIDDEAFVTVENETSYTFSDLKDGAHSVYMMAVDNLGHVGAVDETGAIVDEISSAIAVQSYWPYLIGGIVVLVIIMAAAAYAFMRRKKLPLTS